MEIVVADDNKIVQKTIQRILEKEGHKITLCNDGKELVDSFLTKFYPLVITDLKMPGIDGLEAAKIIKQKYSNVKIIVITGESFENSIFDGFIMKPVQPNSLKDLIAKLMS